MVWLEILRWLHIVGAAVLLGTGAGIAFFMLIPFFLSIYYDERQESQSFLIVVVSIIVLSAAVLSLTRKSTRKTLPTRAGFLMVTLSWGFAALFSALAVLLIAPHTCY